MKRRFSFPALVLLALLSVLLLPGCGSSSRQVPDSVIERDTVDCDYDAGYSRSWTAVHDYDSSSQTDNVAITLTLSSDCGTMTCRRTTKVPANGLPSGGKAGRIRNTLSAKVSAEHIRSPTEKRCMK